MRLLTAFLSLLGVFMFSNLLWSQDPLTEMERNRAVLRYYTGHDVAAFETQDPTNLQNIEYYFTQSFDVALINCANCEIDYLEFFNYDLFNVVEHESKRLANASETFEYKDKYLITLHSVETVLQNLSGAAINEMTNLKVDRPFPQWQDSGDFESDFTLYKKRVDNWARDFPEEYRTLTSSGDLFTIRKEDFRLLQPARKDIVFNHPGGYLITD